MSKVFYVCKKNGNFNEREIAAIEGLPKRILPDHLRNDAAVKNTVSRFGDVVYIIINDKNTFLAKDGSLLCGKVENDGENWAVIGNRSLSGDFSVLRNSETTVEVSSNAVGSRTVWYYNDNEYFIASTSQRALVIFLREFDFNEKVIPWILSTGTLGPELSWDKRFKRLPPSGRIMLDKVKWTVTLDVEDVAFEVEVSNIDHKAKLKQEIRKAIGGISRSLAGWELPLSGGYDSRAILCFLKECGISIKTLTWGVAHKQKEKTGDAYIAGRLAEKMSVTHRYLSTDISNEPVGHILKRFIVNGEGRLDHIAGYMDGMLIWKQLNDAGVKGLVRGDEGFGWVPVTNERSVRTSVGMGLCSDYENLKDVHKFGIPEQELPPYLNRSVGESLACWRDRLYHIYRIPTVLAALTDVKLSYVEQVNPLIFDRIIYCVRSIPDHLREDKALFKEIVEEVSPDVAYAKASSNERPVNILSDSRVKNELVTTLHNYSGSAISRIYIDHVLASLCSKSTVRKTGLKRLVTKYLRSIVPARLRSKLAIKIVKSSVEAHELAFRLYIIVTMERLLMEDAGTGNFN